MKRLLPLFLLCLLLCGCGRQTLPEEDLTEPTEPVTGAVTVPEEYGGAVSTVPLNLRKVRGLRVFQGNILLLSGYGSTELTLLEAESQQELARLILDFQLEQGDITLHNDGTLSFFDSAEEETVVLDTRLREVRRIPAPDALSGSPILSDDGGTLYYCTASHLRAWDLETGIRRCVKEMALPGQRLTAVMQDGILQCETDEGETLFLSSQDGRLLHRGSGSYTLLTREDRYYAKVPAGTYQLAVFGQSEPRLLFPEDPTAELFYLPRHHAALTAAQQEDHRVQLDYYNLSSGQRSHSLTLGAYQMPKAAACLDADTIVLLTYDPDLDSDILTLWDPGSGTAVPDDTGYIHPYPPEDLSGVYRQAAQLGDRYGIRILIGEEAAASAPWDYRFTPETLAPLLQWELSALEQRLSHFPDTVLQQTAAHFSSLNLCLVRELEGLGDSHPEASAGVQYLNGSDAYIAITPGMFSEQTLYHELFHLMEVHIFAESKAFDQWDTLNPAGFSYDYDYAANARRDSGVYLFEENRVFVDTYSMSFPKEDRARILEYAMLPGQEYLFRPAAMQKKLAALCAGIRDAYGLKKDPETFLWEQYLE